MTSYALLLFALAALSFALVMLTAIRLPGLAEVGLASTGVSSFSTAIRALEGNPPTWPAVIMAASGGLLVAISLALHYRAKCRRCAEQGKNCPIYPPPTRG